MYSVSMLWNSNSGEVRLHYFLWLILLYEMNERIVILLNIISNHVILSSQVSWLVPQRPQYLDSSKLRDLWVFDALNGLKVLIIIENVAKYIQMDINSNKHLI